MYAAGNVWYAPGRGDTQERNKSKAYVRSQMQFLMVLASTETHTSSDAPPSHVAAGFSGHAQGAEMEKDAGDWSSHSGRGGSKSMAYEPVSMLQSQTFSMLKSHTCLPDSAPGHPRACSCGKLPGVVITWLPASANALGVQHLRQAARACANHANVPGSLHYRLLTLCPAAY